MTLPFDQVWNRLLLDVDALSDAPVEVRRLSAFLRQDATIQNGGLVDWLEGVSTSRMAVDEFVAIAEFLGLDGIAEHVAVVAAGIGELSDESAAGADEKYFRLSAAVELAVKKWWLQADESVVRSLSRMHGPPGNSVLVAGKTLLVPNVDRPEIHEGTLRNPAECETLISKVRQVKDLMWVSSFLSLDANLLRVEYTVDRLEAVLRPELFGGAAALVVKSPPALAVGANVTYQLFGCAIDACGDALASTCQEYSVSLTLVPNGRLPSNTGGAIQRKFAPTKGTLLLWAPDQPRPN